MKRDVSLSMRGRGDLTSELVRLLRRRRTGGRLQDLSESDFEDDAVADSDEEEPEPVGPPWKCALCDKARVEALFPSALKRDCSELVDQILLLSEATLKLHLESKARHSDSQCLESLD